MAKAPFYARRFVSGTEMEDALESVKDLNRDKISATLDILGENVTKKDQASAFTDEYVRLITAIREQNIDSHVSVKLTMLGLDVDKDFCYENLKKILKVADDTNNRVALDMEGSAYTEVTLATYERAAKEFKSPEIVLQAYLKRTESDIERVLKANGRLRLCKGAYKEPESLAFKNMDDIRSNYKKLVTKLLQNANRTCIASHDDQIIDFCKNLINEKKITQDKYEFQMLYGLRPQTWRDISNSGHPMTIYVPYGKDCMPYFSRRLTERKENVYFVLKNMFKS